VTTDVMYCGFLCRINDAVNCGAYCLRKEICKIIRAMCRDAHSFKIERGKKHSKIRNLVTLDWIPIPSTPSDYRSLRNFKACLERLMRTGEGFVFQKTGRLPVVY